MKIIYIPIVIPVNYRTIFSLVGSFVAFVMLIYACQCKRWNVCELKPTHITAESGTSVEISQSLQSIDIKVCSHTWSQGQGEGRPPMYLCEIRHVIYSECDTVSDSWYQGGQKFTGSFVSLVAAILLVFFAMAVGFLREMMFGPLLLLAGCVQILAATLYGEGMGMSMNSGVLPYLQKQSLLTGGSFTQARGEGYIVFIAGMVLTLASSLLALSLWCCAAHGQENRARHPPSVQVVEMDAMPGVEIAQTAPQPGFVRLSSDSRFSIERAEREDDDDGSLGLVTDHHQHPREVVPGQDVLHGSKSSPRVEQAAPRVSYDEANDNSNTNATIITAAAEPSTDATESC